MANKWLSLIGCCAMLLCAMLMSSTTNAQNCGATPDPESPAGILTLIAGVPWCALTYGTQAVAGGAVGVAANIASSLFGAFKGIFGKRKRDVEAAQTVVGTSAEAVQEASNGFQALPDQTKAKLVEAVQSVENKSIADQVQAMLQVAEKEGEKAKAEVVKLVESRNEVIEEVQNITAKLTQELPVEAKVEVQNIVNTFLSPNLTTEEKKQKLEEKVEELPTEVKEKLKVRTPEEIRNAVESYNNQLVVAGVEQAGAVQAVAEARTVLEALPEVAKTELKETATKVANESVEDQKKAIEEAAAKKGDETKKAFAAAEEALDKRNDEVKELAAQFVADKSSEAKEALAKIVDTITDQTKSQEEMKKQLEQQVNAIPDSVKAELHLNPLEQIKTAADKTTDVAQLIPSK